jgi:VanZ family protein
MIAIFSFSSQNAEKSSELSGSLTHKVFAVIQDWLRISEPEVFDILEIIVRKTAHLTVFFIFGFCVTNTIRQITQNTRYIFFISLGWCSFYAATDEWHQYFVLGRSCMWQDWLIDTVGVLLGIGVAFFIVRLIEYVKKRKQKKKIYKKRNT